MSSQAYLDIPQERLRVIACKAFLADDVLTVVHDSHLFPTHNLTTKSHLVPLNKVACLS